MSCKPCEKARHNRPKATVRVFHAEPGGFDADVEVDHRLLFTDVAYGKVSSYEYVEPGTRKITVKPAGVNETVLFKEYEFLSGNPYTIIIQAVIDEDSGEFETRIHVLLNHNIKPDKGFASMRFVHMSPGSPRVDVLTGDTPAFRNVSYGNTARPPYMDFNCAHNHKLNVRTSTAPPEPQHSDNEPQMLVAIGDEAQPTPTPDDPDNITLLGPIPVQLRPQHVYTLYAIGMYGSEETPLKLVLVKDWPTVSKGGGEYDWKMPVAEAIHVPLSYEGRGRTGTQSNSHMRFLHTNSSPIRVSLNGRTLTQSLPRGSLTRFVAVDGKKPGRLVMTDMSSKKDLFDDELPVLQSPNPYEQDKAYTVVLNPSSPNKKIVFHDHSDHSDGKLRLVNLCGNKIGLKHPEQDDNFIMDSMNQKNTRLAPGETCHFNVHCLSSGDKLAGPYALKLPRKGAASLFIGDDIAFTSADHPVN